MFEAHACWVVRHGTCCLSVLGGRLWRVLYVRVSVWLLVVVRVVCACACRAVGPSTCSVVVMARVGLSSWRDVAKLFSRRTNVHRKVIQRYNVCMYLYAVM